jgi:ABC-type bacteriocin/lantibiotic exporter with double-glycine peptidase domain
MSVITKLSLSGLIAAFKGPVAVTWGLLLFENALIALIPLLIGLAIDDLLSQGTQALLMLGIAMGSLIVLAVARRMYDTRAYGNIKVELGKEVEFRQQGLPVSVRHTRHGLAAELVDFLEEQVPMLFSSGIQIIVSAIVLASIHAMLGWAALALVLAMVLCYCVGHKYFFDFNRGLNSQMEQQVALLSADKHTQGDLHKGFHRHLRKLKRWQVKLSDVEALVYGAIFGFITIFICHNLLVSASLVDISAGQLFIIISYSWEFAEAAVALPVGLQGWTRLREISSRLNQSANLDNVPAGAGMDKDTHLDKLSEENHVN